MEKSLTAIEQYLVDVVIKLRNNHGMTQEDIGVILNVSQSFIARVENRRNKAKYNLNHINLLADYFGISPKDFLPSFSL